MDPLTALATTFDHAHRVIAGVSAEQMHSTTPCREWDVDALVRHTMGVVANIGRGVDGKDLLDDVGSYPLQADLGDQFRSVADGTLAAWRAAGLDGETNIGAGPMPRSVAININLLDTAMHSWDIARATGQPDELPDGLADHVLGVATGFITDELRGFAGFDQAIAIGDDAPPTQRLAAFLGRQP